jgi:hypothetical protein
MSHNLCYGTHKLHYERSITTDQMWLCLTKPSNKHTQYIAAIPNREYLHITITEKLQKYRDLKEEFIRMWRLKTACIMPLILITSDIIPNKLHDSLKVFHLLHVPMHKAVILSTCRIVQFGSSWSVTPTL